MWHTSRGDRTLHGHEAALVRRSIDVMVSALLVHIDDEFEGSASDCETGIAVYDLCTPSQRIGLLHDVARYLLTETDETLSLSALTDATVAAIFIEIRDQLAIEIELGMANPQSRERTWRSMVLAAHRLVYPDRIEDDEEMEPAESELLHHWHEAELKTRPRDDFVSDLRRWELLVNELCDSILWDRDFEMADGFLDLDPGVSRQRRRLLGIDDEYFTTVAPDPRPEYAYELAAKTQILVKRKPH